MIKLYAQPYDISATGFYFDSAEDYEKIRLIVANGECGYHLDPSVKCIHQLDLDVHEVDNLIELAEHFVDEGLFGDVPKAFENYIDYEAIARDLGVEYATINIAGDHFAYRCGQVGNNEWA